jgi:hypothetical protein
LAQKRRQTKSEVIRDAIGELARQEEKGGAKKRPYDLVAHLIGCVKGGPRNLSRDAGRKFHGMLVERARKRAMILVGAGPLIALIHEDDNEHGRCREVFATIGEPLGTV